MPKGKRNVPKIAMQAIHPRRPSSLSLLGFPLLFAAGQRDRPFRRDLSFCLARSVVLPPEDGAEDEHHEIDPGDHHPLAQGDVDAPPPSLPLVTDVEEELRVVRDDAVEFPLDTPPHHLRLVDRPHVQRSALFGLGVADEARPEDGQHEGFLQHVEGDVGDGQELARVRDGEANVRDGEGGQVLRAEG